ncbi:KTSC domain-containing protein [Clavibacter michiganensis]|uniref:KTSC domain-containing protein n=1 Tax=Clavibacter michiganensis TaxID=28447 RepID=UPI000A3CA43E|nr:KTSC domain-containing protein [Clavibacter michiganensis]MDO4036095.1 KTSC domain-containing protein [Clavibacter michiganensis]MDO4101383.1 KTSC domain-containing protein [Clavibacter michiganensis]NIY59271.1 KTSC domain-containing protein [Clavibacter michiganensis subsp. michiganensis]OUE23339.1 hypothetical protein CMMCA001_08175 [Clavibacter michiganensis subsp. michiganensis]QXP03167.1 KTSC domain-containing protein [Clavibacter michiganensis subsp. michiganensis]
MNRIPVTSSNLSAIGYDSVTKTLEIAFKKGGVYQYVDVPKSVYDGLMSASSHGRFFDVNIKKAGYAVRKMSV